jgi:putative DNA primase/helicase
MSSINVVDLNAVRGKVVSRREDESKGIATPDILAGIGSRFVMDCLLANELGDGMLFAEIHRGRFVFMAASKEWLFFNGVHWQIDALNLHMCGVEDVVDAYLRAAAEIGEKHLDALRNQAKETAKELRAQQELIYKRVSRLRSSRGRKSCLEFAHSCTGGLVIRGDELDMDPWLFACANGVLDLRSGVLRDGRPEDYIFRASPVAWAGIDATAPTWEEFVRNIYEENERLIGFVQRLLGYCLTGVTTEHKLPVFLGKGRNGKGTMFETFMRILGGYGGPIQSEMLLDQGKNVRSADAPSPAIMELKGMRLALASETDEHARFSMARVKWLSGGDTLVGRYPHDKRNTKFRPTHKLIYYTNHLPHASSGDFAFWERFLVVDHRLSYVDREPAAENERRQDKELPKRLEDELPGILAWLVRGCLIWQRDGLNPPEDVRAAVEKAKRDEDYLADFFDDCCETGEGESYRVKSTALYDRFEEWFKKAMSSDPKKVPKQRRFSEMVGKRFDKLKSNGIMMFLGLRLLPEQPPS